MNIARIVVLVVAVVAAGLAAVLARGLLSGENQREATAAPGPSVPMTEVLVAASEIPLGSKVQPADLRWQKWPRDAVDAQFITKDGSPNAMLDEAGAIARVTVLAGEPITATKVLHAEAAGFMAAALSPGKRAIAVEIEPHTGAGGFILPNDRVDVILTAQAPRANSRVTQYVTATILKNIRVLAIDQSVGETGEDEKPSILGKTATLELSPAQAELVSQASAQGTISLSLVSLQDGETVAATETETEKLSNTSSVIQVIRYGVQTNVSKGVQ
ncbi:MAG: Flp pilus assembly protein CpaB [Alphaproteobacteria bacterium]|nr:Flp pilus assembly protein CpaB [Alphaproteobacteria bacterium]